MKVIKNINEMRKVSERIRAKRMTIGLVPTMGYLHAGHLSLVKRANKTSNFVIVSIFVNPIQFGPKEDLKKYPRNIKRDLKLLSSCGVDAVFMPKAAAVYPKDFSTYVEVTGPTDKLCGRSRPGHFRGVTTVVAKLFNIIKPDAAFFGLKDFQQQAIIKKMVKELNMGVKIISMPTIREKDGIAMSSRNTYLDADNRRQATVLHKALLLAKKMVNSGEKDPRKVKAAVRRLIMSAPSAKVDYISVCDPSTFHELKRLRSRALIALAVFIGKTRLIDNIIV